MDITGRILCESEARDFRKPWTTFTNHEPAQNLYTCWVRKVWFSVILYYGDEYPTGNTYVRFSKGYTYPGKAATLRINDRVFRGQEGSVLFSRELLDTMSEGGIG